MKTFERSTNTPPSTLFLSKFSLHSFISLSNICWISRFLLKTEIKGEIFLYTESTNLHFIMFSQTFKKQLIKLTGQKLDTSYLSFVFLSIGTTVAMSGNEARLLLIAVSNDVDRKIDSNLTSFVGILSVPDVVLMLRNFGTKFTSQQVTYLAYCKAWLELK